MKIGIYVAELDVRGGTHKQVLKLAQYLGQSGHKVTIYTPCFDPEKTYPEFEKNDVISLRKFSGERSSIGKFFGGLSDQFKLFLKSKSNQIINVHDNRAKFFIILHAFNRSAKKIWQINDLDPSFGIRKNAGTSFIKKYIYHPGNRFFAKIASICVDEITVNVTKNADKVLSFLGKKATVVYCGVDFLPKRIEVPPILETICIVSTGVVFRYRNYESLILAANKINESGIKNVDLIIIGDTKYDQPYVAELGKLAEQKKVSAKFVGSISQDEMNSYYKNAHAFAFLNVDQSWGLAVFEAASMGLPVILSSSVGAVELLSGKSGIEIVDPTSIDEISAAISTIVNDKNNYLKYCFEVTNAVRDMSWDKMYSENIESIFLNHLNGN